MARRIEDPEVRAVLHGLGILDSSDSGESLEEDSSSEEEVFVPWEDRLDVGYSSVDEVFETDDEGPLELLQREDLRAALHNDNDFEESSPSGSVEDFVSSFGSDVEDDFFYHVSYEDFNSGYEADDEYEEGGEENPIHF